MVGTTVSHYRILEKLGEGGMGVVYKAEDTKLRRMVALKFLSARAVGSERMRARFFREAQAAGALNHPNICPVHGIEEDEGNVFLVMAYLEGESLDRLIARQPLGLKRAVDVAIQIGDGLREAHEQGIVHRDIKCANIIVTAKGRAVITDFGLALLSGRSRITQTGTTLGTLAYMSPEQALGKEVDRRSDIWSLGVVLYEMASGQFPFRGATVHEICRAILTAPARPVSEARPGVPDDLNWVLCKALAKKPEERYQHVDDFVVDLRALHRRLPEEAPPGGQPAPPPSALVDHAARTVTMVNGNSITIDTEVRRGGSAALRAGAGDAPPAPPPASRSVRAWQVGLALFAIAIVAGLIVIWWRALGP